MNEAFVNHSLKGSFLTFNVGVLLLERYLIGNMNDVKEC